jgi:predicted MFS family arabinose efflux permease
MAMFSILANRTYRHLFFAQIIALVGTGLATVALGLLAYDIAGGDAGVVLGTALAIKMVAYIGVAPIAGAFANRVPRRALLVTMDAIRAIVAVCLLFVGEVWQVYVLIFLLQSASAAFTPTFQATIPEVLPDERDYTRALSLSRLAYDMESLTSPVLAAGLLTLVSYHWLFSGTAIGFVSSALLVVSTVLPRSVPSESADAPAGIYEKTTRGMRIYLQTPRLRGLLALTLAAAAASAMVIVNTVVIVKGMGLSQRDVALTLAAFGGGSITAALTLPRVLNRVTDRTVMIVGAVILTIALTALAFGSSTMTPGPAYWRVILAGWLVMGIAYSSNVTPSGRLLRRSANAEDRPALFAAQFALSHICWLVCYPLAGQLGARVGMAAAFTGMAVLAALGVIATFWLWPASDPDVIAHEHGDLAADDPHHLSHASGKTHPYVIDRRHANWPGR